jgi:hypothetical protein
VYAANTLVLLILGAGTDYAIFLIGRLPYLLTFGHIYVEWSAVTGLWVVLALAVASLLWLGLRGRTGREVET